MESEMIENYDEPKAFGLSLLVHFILFLIASALGLFSIAEQPGQRAPIDVVLYDPGGDAGSTAGDAAPAPAPAVAIDDIVVEDKTLPRPEESPQQPQRQVQRQVQHAGGTAPAGAETGTGQGAGGGGGNASAGTGSGAGTGTGDGSGGAGSGTLPPPPKERVAASLRAEAAAEYPQELIDDDVEGVVTIKILVAADGSGEAVNVESSSGYRAMDQAAIAAGWRFQFNPGDNGRRGVWTKTFRFRLD